MALLIYTRFPITFAECWYTNTKPPKGVDVVQYFQLPSAPELGYVEEFRTIAIDLRQSQDVLFLGLNKTTRNEIRRGASDGFVHEFLSVDAASRHLKEFLTFYGVNGVVEGRSTEAVRWTSRHAANGTLNLSRVMQSDGRVLVWHAYFQDGEHARLKYSVSLSRTTEGGNLRATISRANRFAHWEDMCHLKGSGACMYDFGGWYVGTNDEKLLRVNQFKQGFGGVLLSSYHSRQAFSIRGKLFLIASGIRRRLRERERTNGPSTRPSGDQ